MVRTRYDVAQAMSAGTPSAAPAGLAETARDLKALRDAVVDAANVSGTLWFSYLFVLLYLMIAAGSVTHADLLLERAVRLPFLNVDLPLKGFAWLGPLLFLIAHAYVLLQFVLFAGKIGVFHMELDAQVKDGTVQDDLRRQLPNNVFVQFLAGPWSVRTGLVGWMLRLIAWITLIAGPVALLVFFQLQFLPYHDAAITWWQRVAVLLDVGLLWLLWPAIAFGQGVKAAWGAIVRNLPSDTSAIRQWPGIRRVAVVATGAASIASIALVFLVATYPGEWIDGASRLPGLGWLHRRLVAGDVDLVSRRLDSLWSNVLVLPGFDAIDHNQFKTDGNALPPRETLSLRGRNIRNAVLSDAIMPRVNFTGADLEDAVLARADLRGASLGCVNADSPVCTDLQGATLDDAILAGATLDGAQLRGVHAENADFRGANLQQAHMEAADFMAANFAGATLSHVHADAADMTWADLRGAVIDDSSLKLALLYGAQLQGLDLTTATLASADLTGALVWRATPIGAEVFSNFIDTEPHYLSAVMEACPGGFPERQFSSDRDVCAWSSDTLATLKKNLADIVPPATIARLQDQLDPDNPFRSLSYYTWAPLWHMLDEPSDDEYAKDFVDTLVSIGCAPNSSRVARAIMRRFEREPIFMEPAATRVAAALLSATCVGMRGLDEDQRLELMAWAAD